MLSLFLRVIAQHHVPSSAQRKHTHTRCRHLTLQHGAATVFPLTRSPMLKCLRQPSSLQESPSHGKQVVFVFLFVLILLLLHKAGVEQANAEM